LPAHALPQMIQISASLAGRLAGPEVISQVSRSRAKDASAPPAYGPEGPAKDLSCGAYEISGLRLAAAPSPSYGFPFERRVLPVAGTVVTSFAL
jgi:hypothetical protein